MIVRAIALCVGAAMFCAVIRTQRPELATAASLAAGCAVLVMLFARYGAELSAVGALWTGFARGDADIRDAVIKAAGIAVIAELGAQLCADAGESALAGRIALASRLAILALCVPLLSGLASVLGQLSP